MHRQLSNQLRRTVGLADAQQVERVLAELRALAHTASISGDAAGLLSGLEALLQRVSSSYDQYERDIQLRARSLQLSSDELAEAYAKLEAEAQIQRGAIEQLRSSVNDLLRREGRPLVEGDAAGLDELAATMAALVSERSAVQHELEMQKFAMDQHAIISITDLDGNIIYANDRFCRISGYSREDLLGNNHRVINSGHHPESFFRSLWQTILAGQVWRGEIRNINKNGRYYWVAATIVPLLGADGQPERFIAIRTDITHRKLAESAMEESRSFLQGITDTVDDGLFRLDENMQCVFLNPAAERQLGIALIEMIEQPFLSTAGLCDAAGNPIGGYDLLSGIDANTTFRSDDLCMLRRNGEIFPVSLAIASLGKSGGEDGWVGSFRDITESKRVQVELAAAKIEADRANQMKGQFLANMSHELRTPLNAVIGLGHLVQQTELQPLQRDYLKKMESASQHLLGLINDILDYSKIEAGKLSIEAIPFNPAESVRDVISLLQPKAQQKGLVLVLDIAPNLPEIILGDRKRLGQILLNLTDNALKFTEQGQVRVSVSGHWRDTQSFHLQISVRDDGIGLTQDQIGRLFQPFVQADGSTARRFGGTGLGLAICRELIELMGGEIGVESIPGVGSHFHFYLVCQRAQSADRSAPGADINLAEPGALLGYSALLVEDDLINQQVAEALLESLGMRIEIASTGAEALQLLARKSFDIVLQDLQLPDMDGYAVTQRIRTELQLTEIPIIALTGFTLDEDRSRCLEAGFNDFVTKPYDFDLLTNTMRRLLGMRDTSATNAVTPPQPTALAELPRAQLKLLVPKLEHLLNAFDPDAMERAQEVEQLCMGSELEYIAQRLRRDVEVFDFVSARKSLDIFKTQYVLDTGGPLND